MFRHEFHTSTTMCTNIINLFLIVVISPIICEHKFPENFKRCHLNDPNLDACLDIAIKNTFAIIGSSGIPSLNIAPNDPVRTSKMIVGKGINAVQLVQNYFDVTVYGFSKVLVEESHFDVRNKILKFTTVHQELRQEANYEINGKIMLFRVFGHGKSIITFREPKLHHIITFKEKTRDSIKYMSVVKYLVHLETKGITYEFRNLFNGNEILSRAIHKVVNENWNVIWEDVAEQVQISYQDLCKEIANGFFENTPFDEIFLK